MLSEDFLGLTYYLSHDPIEDHLDFSRIARVVKEHKELYVIQNTAGSFSAEITGNMRYSAESREDFPAVGDWVEASVFEGGQAIINNILKRFSMLERQSVGTKGEKQVIATNINKAFIVQAVDRDFNLNRLERYFVLAHNGGIEPVIILNKTDLISDEQRASINQVVKKRLKSSQIFMTSTLTGFGLQLIKEFLVEGETYCFIGSSGVGKSTIINHLLGKDILGTNQLSSSTNKGRHTTSHRELIVLNNGSILIDTPGMREVGITEHGEGIASTFDNIAELARDCKYGDCSHSDEPGCNVRLAIEDGRLSYEEYENFKKLERQTEHFSATVAEKRKKDKAFGKMHKEVLSEKKKNKY